MEEYVQEPYTDEAEPAPAAAQPAEPGTERKNRKRRGVRTLALALVCALLGGAAGSVLTASVLGSELRELRKTITGIGSAGAAPGLARSEYAQQRLAQELHTNVGTKPLVPSEVFDAYADSVVAINVESTSTNVFGQVSARASSGSGFILTEDGDVVTNYHVVEGAEKVTVAFDDGEVRAARIVGLDPANDVALLHVDAAGLHPVSVGDSDELTVGEPVCAIGNPLGELTNTLTVGYVSALDRELNTDGKPINMLQTDCAINAGNSGGPLFDMNGNVIAITTAKYYGSTIEGLCFAIPINDALRVVSDLREYGYVIGRPYLGVTVMDMDSATTKLYGLPAGVYVSELQEESCAERAGVREKDILTALGSYPVSTKTELQSALKHFRAGDTTTVTVFRSGAELTLLITLDEREPETAGSEGQTPGEGSTIRP